MPRIKPQVLCATLLLIATFQIIQGQRIFSLVKQLKDRTRPRKIFNVAAQMVVPMIFQEIQNEVIRDLTRDRNQFSRIGLPTGPSQNGDRVVEYQVQDKGPEKQRNQGPPITLITDDEIDDEEDVAIDKVLGKLGMEKNPIVEKMIVDEVEGIGFDLLDDPPTGEEKEISEEDFHDELISALQKTHFPRKRDFKAPPLFITRAQVKTAAAMVADEVMLEILSANTKQQTSDVDLYEAIRVRCHSLGYRILHSNPLLTKNRFAQELFKQVEAEFLHKYTGLQQSQGKGRISARDKIDWRRMEIGEIFGSAVDGVPVGSGKLGQPDLEAGIKIAEGIDLKQQKNPLGFAKKPGQANHQRTQRSIKRPDKTFAQGKVGLTIVSLLAVGVLLCKRLRSQGSKSKPSGTNETGSDGKKNQSNDADEEPLNVSLQRI